MKSRVVVGVVFLVLSLGCRPKTTTQALAPPFGDAQKVMAVLALDIESRTQTSDEGELEVHIYPDNPDSNLMVDRNGAPRIRVGKDRIHFGAIEVPYRVGSGWLSSRDRNSRFFAQAGFGSTDPATAPSDSLDRLFHSYGWLWLKGAVDQVIFVKSNIRIGRQEFPGFELQRYSHTPDPDCPYGPEESAGKIFHGDWELGRWQMRQLSCDEKIRGYRAQWAVHVGEVEALPGEGALLFPIW